MSKVTFENLTAGQTVTIGGLTFTSTATTTAAQVAESFGVLEDGATAGSQKSNVAFQALTVGQTVTVAGLTLTAGSGGITAADVAQAFSALSTGTSSPAYTPANATWTGTFTGFSSPAYTAAATTVNFTNSPFSNTIASLNESISTGTPLVVATSSTTYGTWSGALSGFNSNYTAGNAFTDFTSTTVAGDVTDLATSTTGTALTVATTPAYPGDVVATFLMESGESVPLVGKLNTTAVTESANVTFNDVTTGQIVSVGGLSFTATQNATAAQVAASFGTLTDNATSGVDSTYGTWTGKFTGFTTAYTSGNSYITATSTTASTNVSDIVASSLVILRLWL